MGRSSTMSTVLPTGELKVEEIAEGIEADHVLLGRVIRLLGGMGMLKEVGEHKYANGQAYAEGSPFPHAVRFV